MESFTGDKPVMFLDDVMSELDENRQDYILNHLKDQQVFITCCDPNTIHQLKQGALFKIHQGELIEQMILNLKGQRRQLYVFTFGTRYRCKMSEVVGIFDLETSTISKITREFLAKAEKSGKVINVSMEMPKLLYCAKIIKKIPSFIFLKYLLPLC